MNAQFKEQIENKLGPASSMFLNPLRWGARIGRRIKRNIYSLLYGLLRKSLPLRIYYVNELIKEEKSGCWVPTAEDPYFLFSETFMTGWVEISWVSTSERTIPLRMYFDHGTGMLESESIVIGKIKSGPEIEQKVLIYIQPNTRMIRLDMDQCSLGTEFTLTRLAMKKVYRIGFLIRTIQTYFENNGQSYKSWNSLMKKALQIYRTNGIVGLWSKIRGNSSLHMIRNPQKEYEEWLRAHELTQERRKIIRNALQGLSYQPLISILLPVYNVDEVWLRRCIDSVCNQIYPNWELCIADDASTKAHIREVLEDYTSKDSRIKVVFRTENGHISESSNTALEIATGEFVALLDHDDELTHDALFENVKLLNEFPDADMIYSDEDKISESGKRHSPFFKPDWSPDLFLSCMYTCHLGVYRTELLKKIGGFRKGFEGSQDYDLVLRFTEHTNKIYHIPKILYHWRTIPQSTASGGAAKQYTQDAGFRALQEAIDRRNINGWVEPVNGIPNAYLVHHTPIADPSISILIPTRDMPELLDQCLTSIYDKTTYEHFEVIVIDNGSIESETFLLFDKWKQREPNRFQVVRYDVPFNYSRLNNLAVQEAKGELILLLNNDIEVITSDWLQEMAGQAMRKEVGAVGALLFYPDDTVQHAGVVLGIGGIANHSHKHFSRANPGYFAKLRMASNYSAVTGACLMVRKELYHMVNGLEEELAVAFNDVDFCLKLRESGFYNVWMPNVQLYHHESKSRGIEDTPEKKIRFQKEIDWMSVRWNAIIQNDPFYNPNLTRTREDYSIEVE